MEKSNTRNDATAKNQQDFKMPSDEHKNNVQGVNRYFNRSDFFPLFAFLFLTYNAVMSGYRSWHNPWDLVFVISCYTELILLFGCMKLRENLGDYAPQEKTHWLKLVVFVLTTLLTVTFAYRVSLIMPLSLKIVVCAMSGSVIAAGFYAFFTFDSDVKEANNGYCKLGDAQEKV